MEKNLALTIETDVNLKPYNSFGISAIASEMIRLKSEEELPDVLRYVSGCKNLLLAGGGSNMLFTKDWDGIVLRIETKGIEVLDEDQDFVYVRAQAGEIWDDFVLFCIQKGYGGLENLSAIPGNVGSSPIQNIGAYGVELKDVFYMLEAVSLRTGEFREFYKDECQFDYRNSVFKADYIGQYLIISVIFKLRKSPVFNISYGAIESELKKQNLPITLSSVRDVIIKIRSSKLPDPLKIGNAGSFFKNPMIQETKFTQLISKYPGIQYYKAENGYKIAAGWMIEQCGWKGYREGDAGVHERQALVLVNYGNATGIEIKLLSQKIIDSVAEKFDIFLQPEVNIY